MGRPYIMRKPRGSRGPYTTRLKALQGEIVEQLDRGVSCRALARKYHCDKDTVARIKRERGAASRDHAVDEDSPV